MSDLYTSVPLPPALAAALFRQAAASLGGALSTFPPDFVPPALLDADYVPPNRGPMLMWFGIALLAAAVVVVGVRLAARRWIVGAVGRDDWLIVGAVVCLGGYTGTNIAAVGQGMGRHVYDVTLAQIAFVLKMTYIHNLLYILTSFFVKLSILTFYHRLVAAPATRPQQLIVKAMMCLVGVYTVAALLACAFICRPAHAYWTLLLRFGNSCPSKASYRAFILILFSVHVATDCVILLLPVPLVLRLRTVGWAKKAGLVALFGAGGLACVASVLRLVFFPKLQEDVDVTWNVVMVVVWGQLEAALAVCCASVPALRALFRGRSSRVVGAGGGGGGGGMGGGIVMGVWKSWTGSPAGSGVTASTVGTRLGGGEGDLEAQVQEETVMQEGVGNAVDVDGGESDVGLPIQMQSIHASSKTKLGQEL
ncbi:hypothetical protein EDC01DRAFT_791087 [Geopyxis carbonaria]|nr:hypothetical protein EDC01DRAFT_791087 [Geopyxis carbonaria]